MNARCLLVPVTLLSLFVGTNSANALTTEQFIAICASADVQCGEHPLLNAYVGGALDLISVLDEETEYLGEVYCRQPTELFDVPAIIRYMERHSAEYANQNAMFLLIRYFEEFGGCSRGE